MNARKQVRKQQGSKETKKSCPISILWLSVVRDNYNAVCVFPVLKMTLLGIMISE
jgi:hypothetical protein